MSPQASDNQKDRIPAPPGRGAKGTSAFLLFLVVVFSIYAGVNAFLFAQITLAAHLHGYALNILQIILLLWALSFPMGRMLPGGRAVARGLRIVGSWYLAVMAYSLLVALAVDLVLLSNLLLGWIPDSLLHSPAWGRGILLVSTAVVLGIVVGGNIRSRHPVILRLDVPLEKYPKEKPPVVLAMISDLHLGAVINPARVQKFARLLEKVDPDLICIVGDLIDETPSRLRRHIEPFSKLKPALDIYAVTGNHEYYNGRDESVELMKSVGIRVLEDEAVEVAESLLLIGVEDRPGAMQRKQPLPPLDDLLATWKHHPLPKILLHHTPVMMDTADRNDVALQLSGHTHGGQLWPFGGMSKRAYGIAKGWKTFERGMKLFVSVGLGTWGPPVRVGNAPQIVLLNLHGS